VELRIGDAVNYGWNVYWKNVGTLVVIALVIFAIEVAVGVVGSAIGGGGGMQFLAQVVGNLIGLFLTLGWMRVSIEITRGVRPEVGDLFKARGYGPFIVASILFYIGLVIGLILLIVPGIVFAVVYGFYGFVIAERGDDAGITESLKRSADITRGHRWTLFGLGLVLILINFLGVLACGVGLLFTWGISILAWAYAYRTLSGETVERDAWA
jgi:uncharacterized membrane protein